jgi:SNF2 family DNA or RNA helicase
MLQLHEYQRRAVQFALTKKASYQMVDIGLGKTAIALMTARKLKQLWNLPTFVWAPLRVCYLTWPEEIKIWTPEMSYTIMHGDLKNATLKLKRDIYICNYEGIKWFYNQARKGKFHLRKFFMVWDESSMLKDSRTARWKTFADKMYPIYSPYRMHLSATPATEGLPGLWAQYYLLNPRVLGTNYYSFFYRNFNEDQYTRQVTPKTGAKKRIYDKIVPVTFRLSSRDYSHYKEPVKTVIPARLPRNVTQLYRDLMKNFMVEMPNGVTVEADVAAGLTQKLQQVTQGAFYYHVEGERRVQVLHYEKAEALKTRVEEAQGNPMVVAIQYRFEYDMICKVLGRRLPIIYGQTTAAQSVEYCRQWNLGKISVLLCHPRSVRYGLNLQKVGHLITWYGLTWSLEDYLQFNGRLARQGQTKVVNIGHIVMQGTLDEVIMSVQKSKSATQDELFNAVNQYMKQSA